MAVKASSSSRIRMIDFIIVSFDALAIIAVSAFTSLSLMLANGLRGSGLRRGFTLASLAGMVHIAGNLM